METKVKWQGSIPALLFSTSSPGNICCDEFWKWSNLDDILTCWSAGGTALDVRVAAAEYRRQRSSAEPNSTSTISSVSRAPCVVSSSTPATSSVWWKMTGNSSARPTTWPSIHPVSWVRYISSFHCLLLTTPTFAYIFVLTTTVRTIITGCGV